MRTFVIMYSFLEIFFRFNSKKKNGMKSFCLQKIFCENLVDDKTALGDQENFINFMGVG